VWVSMCVRYAMFDGQVCPMGERKCGYYLCLMGKCALWVSVNVDITYV